MATYTPRHRVSLRPSFGGAGASNSPNLLDRASTNMHRNASYNALTGQPPTTPGSKLDDAGFTVGDIVNVPGDMFGTVRFIGSVHGKAGTFLGVELAGEYAARGKNSGDVEGVSYFETSVPGSGIFLPLHRAQRRFSPSAGQDGTKTDSPDTPTPGTVRGKRPSGSPNVPKFAQTVGPGARPASPQLKPRPRQSLPRPESPLRRAPNLQPTPGRQFSQSVRPGARPPTTPSAAKSATPRFSASVRGGAPPARPYSRTGSRLGNRSESISHAPEPSRRGVTPASLRSPSRLGRAGDDVVELQLQISEKDRQLQEQAAQLADMEAALKEVQSLMPDASPTAHRSRSTDMSDGSDPASLQRAVREKNDKIASLVTEFDAHRADFRSTIETLESASEETVRMYEARIAELTGEIEALREEGAGGTSQADVEAIANQLKMLEELVAELEDGLEDARRGEAEARGEVEFLRGEVERGRSELRREREKAAAAAEHETNGTNGHATDAVDVADLRAQIARLEKRNAELEASNKLAPPPIALHTNGAPRHASVSAQGSSKCEGCDKPGHDLLHCPVFAQAHRVGDDGDDLESPVAGPHPSPRLDRDPGFGSLAGPKRAPTSAPTSAPAKDQTASRADDADKWCALCEQDGHLAFDCPNEQY